jgi:hypothetical protein
MEKKAQIVGLQRSVPLASRLLFLENDMTSSWSVSNPLRA